MGKGKTEIHRFFCTVCGDEGIPIARQVGKKRGMGHLKKLYCTTCKKETNHCEIEPNGSYTIDDFMKDYRIGEQNGGVCDS